MHMSTVYRFNNVSCIFHFAVQAELDRANQMWINYIEQNKGRGRGMRSWDPYETDIPAAIQFSDRPGGKFHSILSIFLNSNDTDGDNTSCCSSRGASKGARRLAILH